MPVMLALFWESPWGVSVADCHLVNEARMAFAKARILERENKLLLAQIAKLESELLRGDRVAANLPVFQVGGRL